jgi:hypothetical protein
MSNKKLMERLKDLEDLYDSNELIYEEDIQKVSHEIDDLRAVLFK